MADGKPTLHHLNNSQSMRILWLLEELGIPYNLELHKRQTSGPDKQRAPAALAKTHPLGKSPQLVTAEGRVIVESSAIAKYLIEKYDTSGKFHGDGGKNDSIRDEEISSIAGASINPMMLVEMLFDILTSQSPFFIRPLFSGLHGVIHRKFTGLEMEKLYKYLNDQLDGQDYFMGSSPGRADFVTSWPVDFCVQRGYINIKDYPKLDAWYDRCHQREGWKRALNKGNGYDLKAGF